ncbi:uncharacterized protein [Hyperolius riggenbachi]|uniref:uncharacterized protein n=1 Tax=Hyperolius riggenbachi TaxID=752182 RepID=UPI0035A38D84
MQDTIMYRTHLECKTLLKKLAQLDSDIFFLSKCKKENLIPKGITIRNPVQHTFNTHFAQRLCFRTSERIRNHLIKVCYSKKKITQDNLCLLYSTLQGPSSESIKSTLQKFYKQLQHHLIQNKKKKLDSLRLKAENIILDNNTSVPRSEPKTANLLPVVNLSSYNPSKTELAVLSKGLTFSPTKRFDEIEFCSDMEEFFRRIRLKEFFHNRPNYSSFEDTEPASSKNKKSSTWTPKLGRNKKLEEYIDNFRKRIKLEILDKQKQTLYNLNTQERKAILSLKSNDNIVIKPADKGGAVVILDKSSYIQEANRQLSNNTYYKRLETNPTLQYSRELKNMLNDLSSKSSNILTLIPANPKIGTFYILPKIHKEGNPGRPIISGLGTLTEKISGWVENILKPMVRNTASYIQDTTDLLNKLTAMGPIPEGAILATMDVESLYTNIPHEDGIAACQHFLQLNDLPTEPTLQLIRYVLTHNYFSFGNDMYLQTMGSAMGSRMSPQYANLFMARLEENFLSTCEIKPWAYFRFIDDILLIWTASQEE